VARHGKILGCRALTLLHDHAGHPLLALTERGDQHLTLGLPQVVAGYERKAGQGQLAQIVVDREGMGAAFLQEMSQNRMVITLLRTDQYQGLDSFTEVGEFVPFEYDRCGTLIREVAPAKISLTVPNSAQPTLPLWVALVRDLRRQVPVPPDGDSYPYHWDEDLRREAHPWWEGNWSATAAPATPTTPKLIPVVSTAESADALQLAQTYFHRWAAQENSIRDFLIPLGLDINHGFAKTAVENSETAKRRSTLLKRLENCQRWGEKAHRKGSWNAKRHRRLYQETKAYAEAQYDMLNRHMFALERSALVEERQRMVIKEEQRLIDADLRERWSSTQRVLDRSNSEWRRAAPTAP
jgi:hypothetical protein